MSVFREQLKASGARLNESQRRWFFVPYDQLTDAVGPLSRANPRDVGIVLVECPAKAARRPYHKQKLALVLTSLRHFALEQSKRGVAVRYLVDQSYAAALRQARELGRIGVMRPAERELRAELAPLVESGAVELLPHEGWLTTTEDFQASVRGALRAAIVHAASLGIACTLQPAASPPRVAQPTMPRTGNALSRSGASATLGAAAASLGRCRGRGPGHIKVTFTPDGLVHTAVVDVPPSDDTDSACIERVFRECHVPPFDGPPVPVGKAFTL